VPPLGGAAHGPATLSLSFTCVHPCSPLLALALPRLHALSGLSVLFCSASLLTSSVLLASRWLWQLPRCDPLVWNSSMWKHRVHQGLVDFTQFTVHCPSFLEAMLRLVFARAPASRELLAAAVEWGKFQHRLEVEAGLYEDPYGQVMACGERVLGLHLVANLKAVPWAQALLNFWVGERVWEGYDDSPWPKHERDLAVAEPETRRTEW